MTKDEIKRIIEAGLPGARADVRGDDGQHFEAEVVFGGFAGKPVVQQHRMVYEALGGRMGREIHALQLKTRAQPSLHPEERSDEGSRPGRDSSPRPE